MNFYSHRKGSDKSTYLPNKLGAGWQVGDLEQSGEIFAIGFRGFLVSSKWLCVYECMCSQYVLYVCMFEETTYVRCLPQ